MTTKSCVNHPGATDHDTSECPWSCENRTCRSMSQHHPLCGVVVKGLDVAADRFEVEVGAAQSAPDERDAVLSAGNGLSNIAYTLAQLEGVPLSRYTCELLRMQREQWNKAVASWQRAQSAPVVPLASSLVGRIYLAGPMTGIEHYNFPAFNAEASRLRAQGFHVENPAEHGIVEGADWADYLRYDIGRLATCERIHLLPGWSKSKGARLEVHIAQSLGMHVWYAEGAEDVPAQPAARQEQGDELATAYEAMRVLEDNVTEKAQAIEQQGDEVRRLREALEKARPCVIRDMEAAVRENFGRVGNDPWACAAVDARDAIDAALSGSAEGKA